MKSDWDNETTAQLWSAAVGDHGDLFQKALVNPFICRLAKAIQQGRLNQYEDIPGSIEKCFFEEQTDLDQLLRPDEQKLTTVQDQDLLGMNILDLGAGEGYLTRMLMARGAHATIIDSSDSLLKLAQHKLGSSKRRMCIIRHDLDSIDCLKPFHEILPSLGDNQPNLVCCIALLDHLATPGNLLASLRLWLGRRHGAEAPPLVCTTLNPDFFFGAKQWDITIKDSRKAAAVLGPASVKATNLVTVEVYQRSWMEYEKIFTQAGYQILWCHASQMSTMPKNLRERLIDEASLPTDNKYFAHPASGPFVFWVLMPQPVGEKASLEDLVRATKGPLGAARFFDLIKEQADRIAESDIIRQTFLPNSPFIAAHNLSDGCHVVEKGEIILSRHGYRKQSFKAGDFIGELESGDDYFVSRYLYPLNAGEEGATTLLIPKATITELISMGGSTLPGQLFKVLRDRVATHSWIYHKSAGKGESITSELKNVSTVSLEHCARAILFCATIEQRTRQRTNGLSMVVTSEQLLELTREKLNPRPTNKYDLDLLNAIGIIDAFPLSPATSKQSDEVLNPFWTRIVELSVTKLLSRPEGDLSADAIRRLCGLPILELNRQHYDKDLLGAKKSLRFSKAVNIDELTRDLKDILGNNSKKSIVRWLGNLALVKHLFVLRKSCAFIHINDMHFLRRIACSADDWRTDLERRWACTSLKHNGRPVSSLEQISQLDRYGPYLRRLEGYLNAVWSARGDLQLSIDSHFSRPNLIHQMIDHYSN